MKGQNTIIFLIILFIITGCAGTPKIKPQDIAIGDQSILIVEHKESAAGKEMPEWVTSDPDAVEDLQVFSKDYVFIFRNTGYNLTEMDTWMENFQADSQIAEIIVERTMEKYNSSSIENKNTLQPFIKETSQILEVAEYVGTRKKEIFWLLEQLLNEKGKPADKIYRFYMLYLVPRDQVNSAISLALRIIDEKYKPETEAEWTIRNRIMELYNDFL
jgi:hypothetical protein